MCAYVSIYRHMHATVQLRRSENSPCPSSPSTLFETGSCGVYVGPGCSVSDSHLTVGPLKHPASCGSKDPNSGPHACTLPTKPFPQALHPTCPTCVCSVPRTDDRRDYIGQTRSSPQTLGVMEAGRGVCLYPEDWGARKPLRNGIFLQGHGSFSSSK